MKQPLRGVNLGGWLVLEPWITPSLFKGSDALDEHGFCAQGPVAHRALQRHHDTFIAEQDFAWLAKHNIQAVRLPVGYWLFGDVLPYAKTVEYVDKAFGWAKKYGLRVLLDLHGAPGSQNGTIHSGRQGEVGWNTPANREATLRTLERLGRRYGRHPSLLGISLLNEPSKHLPITDLQIFYEQAIAVLRPLCQPDTLLVFSDAFRPRRWRRMFQRAGYLNVAVDYHHYQIFTWIDKLLPAAVQLWRAKYLLPHKLRRMGRCHAVIVGEWSAALPAGKASTKLQQRYLDAQLAAFETAEAWFYWTYKTEHGGPWSYRDVV